MFLTRAEHFYNYIVISHNKYITLRQILKKNKRKHQMKLLLNIVNVSIDFHSVESETGLICTNVFDWGFLK